MDSAAALAAVRNALDVRDPDLDRLILALVDAPDKRSSTPTRSGALTLAGYQNELRSNAFAKRTRKERHDFRVARMSALEATDAEVPLPERFRAWEPILALWEDNGPFARATLLKVIEGVSLKWGPWRALKRIFKEAEAKGDLEIYGALAARFDAALSAKARTGEVSRGTLLYLARRAWRNLRKIGHSFAAAYADAAVDTLRFYPNDTRWQFTWVANHIFFHDGREYSRRRFKFRRLPGNLLKQRAFSDAWKRSPRPLFRLLETGRAEQVRSFAVEALKTDFRAALREVEPSWVARLVGVKSASVDNFVIWILNNVPRFEQGAFRALGLHEPVLALLESPSNEARAWAAAYARTHARDLTLDQLIELANNSHDAVRALARDLLHDRDPRKDVGLDGWGRLLGTHYGHDIAAAAIRKHFGARELGLDWFKERLLSDNDQVFRFASDLLLKVHTAASLGHGFFVELLDDPRLEDSAADWALDSLARMGVKELDREFLRRALLQPLTSDRIADWVDEDRVRAHDLGAEFLKALAFQPTWDKDSWVAALRKSGRAWARGLSFDEDRAERVLGWLGDVRRFKPDELGFDWLIALAQRSEPVWHDFAEEYMIKAFLPADFAPKDEAASSAAAAGPSEADLGGKSFLFTGKLATMTRDQAEAKVVAAKGANASGVSPKLDYLVVGDDGSPLYGNGKKGSKQVAAEKLIAKGEKVKVISETAFLQMLSGQTRTVSADALAEGAGRLWTMATGPGPEDAPLARFARQYIRRHHTGIGLALTERHVDPGAEIPASFLTWERLAALLADLRKAVRELGIELCSFELGRLAPALPELARAHEGPWPEVRAFLARVVLADESRDHDRYRQPAASFSANGVYRFAESLQPHTRALGLALLAKYPALSEPDQLFRLTESPDRSVRAFAIRSLWARYHDAGTQSGWKPAALPAAVTSKRKGASPPAPPPARPATPPASAEALRDLLRQVLYGVPPGRPPLGPQDEDRSKDKAEDSTPKLRGLSHRKAKVGLVEVVRDLGVEDAEFAVVVLPVLREFVRSVGPSEKAAAMVALARLNAAHPNLNVWGGV